MESFADYFILNEITQNYDAGWLSTYLYKDVGGKYKMVIWDFNSACDNYQERWIESDLFQMESTLWQQMLFRDEDYCLYVIDRYRYLRKNFLSDEYLMNYIDDTVAYLGPAVERNFEIWGYSFQISMLEPEERNPINFEDAVSDMKAFLQQRGAWMDENIEVVQQYGHPSAVKKYNH